MGEIEKLDLLENILSKEYQGYREMLELSRRKREALSRNDINGLNEITEKERHFVEEIQNLEKKRLEFIKDMAEVWRIDAGEIGFEHLIGKSPEPYATKFNKIKQDLILTLSELNGLNDLNAKLINQSLEFVNHVLDTITRIKSKGKTYGDKADLKKDAGSAVIDKKI